MKYLVVLLVAVALLLFGLPGGCTKWKEQVSTSSYAAYPTRLTDFDIELLKAWAEDLRTGDPRAFEKAGGEPELMRLARIGKVDLDMIEEILDPRPYDSKLFDAFNKDFFKSYGDESVKKE